MKLESEHVYERAEKVFGFVVSVEFEIMQFNARHSCYRELFYENKTSRPTANIKSFLFSHIRDHRTRRFVEKFEQLGTEKSEL